MTAFATVLFLLAWVSIGLLTAFTLRRRGHDLVLWSVLGGILGPLAIPVSRETIRHQRSGPAPTNQPLPEGRAGVLDVLCGVDGSDDSIAAARAARDLFPAVGTSLVFATVVNLEAANELTPDEFAGSDAGRDATRLLAAAASVIGDADAERVILTGEAAQTLEQYALDHGFDMLVVARTGAGRASALTGRTAQRLLQSARVPVFIPGSTRAREQARSLR